MLPDSSDARRPRHVANRWRDADAPADEVARLVYRSNLLGADLGITNTGGGNTSAKVGEILWIKGSGGDLRTATADNFAALDLPKLHAVKRAYETNPARGLKSPAEDDVVAQYAACASSAPRVPPSIDTPLHAFVPARHVDHTHPNAVIAIAATRRSRELTQQVFGDDVGWLPWMRPGMELALALEQHVRRNPHHVGVVLAQHGLINWADDGNGCYARTIDLVERAARFVESHDHGEMTFGGEACDSMDESSRDALLIELLPWLRGRISTSRPMIATVETAPAMQRFVNSVDAPRLAALGTSCPDHFLRTKITPLLVRWNPQRGGIGSLRDALDAQLAAYRTAYARYYESHRQPDSPPMRDPNPAIVLIPGIGMIAWGKNKSESRIAAECYNCAVEVMRGAESIDEYVSLPPGEAFDIEYWSLEEAKLRRLRPEGPIAGRVVVVSGGGAIAERLCVAALEHGAHVVFATPDAEESRVVGERLLARFGRGMGVAGSGLSSAGRSVSIQCGASLHQPATLAYGGVDHIVIVDSASPGSTVGIEELFHKWDSLGARSVIAIQSRDSITYAVVDRRQTGLSLLRLDKGSVAEAVARLLAET